MNPTRLLNCRRESRYLRLYIFIVQLQIRRLCGTPLNKSLRHHKIKLHLIEKPCMNSLVSLKTTMKTLNHKGQPQNKLRLQRRREDDEDWSTAVSRRTFPLSHMKKSPERLESAMLFLLQIMEGKFPSRLTSLVVWGPLVHEC